MPFLSNGGTKATIIATKVVDEDVYYLVYGVIKGTDNRTPILRIEPIEGKFYNWQLDIAYKTTILNIVTKYDDSFTGRTCLELHLNDTGFIQN